MTSDSGAERKFWQVALADLEQQLGAGRNGLSSAEATARRLRYGPNTLEERRRLSLPLKFLSRFRNPLVIILLAAAVISALTGDLTSCIIISTIVLMSAALDTVQEFRAEQAAESLKVSVALKEQVLRDGKEVTVLGQDLVPGDVVLLADGDLVPADGRLLEARDLFVNEALLTGGCYPAEKHARDEGVDSPEVASATNAAFMGSSVMNGSAQLMVCGTGLATQLGQISSSLRRAPPPSALDQGTHRFGMLIVRFTEILVLFVLLINLLFHRPWLESFLFAVALAVGLTPELLPMILSVTLARGGIRMAKVQVIVKRLGAIHDLGSMDVLCTDKTGTLTEAKISLAKQIALSGVDSPHVLELAWLNSHFQAGLRNPLDAAIAEGCSPRDAGWTKIDEVPFDFQRRRVFQARHMRLSHPRRVELGAERHDEQRRKRFNPVHGPAEHLQARGVDPVQVLEDHQHRLLACQPRELRHQRFQRSLPSLLRGQLERGIASVIRKRQHLGEECGILRRGRGPCEQRIELVELRLRFVVVRQSGGAFDLVDDRVERAVRA